MGAWSAGSFGNDAALDFVHGLADVVVLTRALAEFAKDRGSMEADRSSAALAACDLLAASIGRPPTDLPQMPDFKGDLASKDVPSAMLRTARTVAARVRKTSELAELWAEEDDTEWQEGLDDLLARLTPSKP